MYKKIIFASAFLLTGYFSAMQQQQPINLSLEQRVKLRVAAFNDWKKDPGIATKLQTDEPGTVQAYIHLTMFMREPEEVAKSPEKLAEATQLAQQACPSYQFWPDFFEVYSRTKRGKCYSAEEQMELVLGPTMTKITRLKMMIAMLKGQEIASIPLTPDWKKEIETMDVLKKDLSLLPLIPVVIPPKKQELKNLKQEFEQCFLVDNFASTMRRQQENRQRLAQQEQVHADLQRQIQLANENIKNGQDALQTKEQDLTQERSIKARLLGTNHRSNQAVKAKESEVEQLKAKQNRIASCLALFEASKMTGWEVAFVETLKSELGK